MSSSATDVTSGGLVTISVKVSGSEIPDTMEVQDIEIEKSANRIAIARLTILDGQASTGTFDASSSSTFVPGNDISIEVGYDSKNNLIFKGIITQQALKIHGGVGSVLEIECRDEAIKMIVGRKSLTFTKQKDSDIISTIIGNYSGLSSSITATTTQWPEQVQYYATDWDFVLARAEANGYIVTTLNGNVAVFPPDNDTTSVLTIQYGDNLLEFNANLNAITQLGSVKASSWDYSTQAVISGDASNNYSGPGNLSSDDLSEVVGLSDYQLQTTAPIQTDDLSNWSKAVMTKSSYSKIQGDVLFQGSSLVDPGKYMTLAGLGDRFNGDYLISGVSHKIAHGNWTTKATLGLSPIWFTEEPDVMAPPASGLLPGAQGLFNGTVKQIYEDPDSQYRILIDLPLFDANGEGLWARLTNFYSSSGAGVFFLPEVGDEVIVGFLNEDPRFPIILGSVYSSTNNKPAEGLDPNENNSIKAIVTKSGISVKFDDENIIYTIETPSKNTMILSDQDAEITIKDQNNNSIVMSDSGITISSDSDINIEASQNLTLSGDMGVSIKSTSGDVQIEGLNIKNSADVEFSAEGSATVSIEGGGETTIKGAMVMIN